MSAYGAGAQSALTKLAVSDDTSVAMLHALGLTPVAIGADGITAPGGQWIAQPILTTGAAALARPIGQWLGQRLGQSVSAPLSATLNGLGVGVSPATLGAAIGGALASGGAAYGARRFGRAMSGDYNEY